MIDALLDKTRSSPDFKSLDRVLQIIKQVFKSSANAEDAENKEYDEEAKPKSHGKKKNPNIKKEKKHVFAKALSTSEEYVKLLKFFGSEMPVLILKLVDTSLIDPKQPVKKDSIPMNKVSKKMKNLLKAFSSLYTSLLAQALDEDKSSGAFLALFFGDGAAVARCILTHHVYHKKLALSLAGLVMDYSNSLDKPSMVLAFITLKNLFPRKRNQNEDSAAVQTLFEATVKRMYNEFARVSKFGGGAYNI